MAPGVSHRSRAFWRYAPMTASALGGFVALQGLWAVPWLMQVGGQLGLVLTLDGVTLCVVPLGPRAEPVHDAVVA